MLNYNLDNSDQEVKLFETIKEDYLYNFSLYLNYPLVGPHMLQFLLTTRCNLKCKMCGVWQSDEEELESYYVKKIIDDTFAIGNLQEVYFTGGEVLLRTDILSLVKYVKDHYPGVRTTLNTNGLLLNRKMIDRLIDVELEVLGISIDSPDAKIHNFLRGDSVFEHIVEALNYINSQKKKRGTEYPLIVVCSILMDQTLDTMYEMVDFCLENNIRGFFIQPYVCNSDLRGKRNDLFWIKEDRLKDLQNVLDRIDSRKEKTPFFIGLPKEKIYNYFSKHVYIDNCFAGFTRALVVGKKVCFVCTGENNETKQHFGEGDKDSIKEVWLSKEANAFRKTIKKCKRNCTQFCSIRPTSDSSDDIHKRSAGHKNLFLLFRELHFLEQCRRNHPDLPINNIIEADYKILLDNIEVLLRDVEYILKTRRFQEDSKLLMVADLKLFKAYLDNSTKDNNLIQKYLPILDSFIYILCSPEAGAVELIQQKPVSL